MPKTKLGKSSLGLIIAMPLFFIIGSIFVNTLYEAVPASDTLLGDLINRPSLSIPMLLGFASGISAFITGLIAVVRHKERAILVFASTLVGAFLIAFLLGELLFPH